MNKFKVVPARLLPPWQVVDEAAVKTSGTCDPGTLPPASDDEDSDDEGDDNDSGSDGEDSEDPNDHECEEDWFKHATTYLKKVMRK